LIIDYAKDGDGLHGIYTEHLLKVLSNAQGKNHHRKNRLSEKNKKNVILFMQHHAISQKGERQ
jgi:hypothetical protein